MSVPFLRLDDGEDAALGLLAWMNDARARDPEGFEDAKVLLWLHAVFIAQRLRLPRAERARFTVRADRVLAKLATRRQTTP